jgi:hypothetical protein
MFRKLKSRWNVSGVDLFLILLTFATGGSLCGWLGRKILSIMPLQHGMLWWILYLIIICILWPICVLVLSLFTGQYSFFKKYLNKMKSRLFGSLIWIFPLFIDQTWMTPTLNGMTGA